MHICIHNIDEPINSRDGRRMIRNHHRDDFHSARDDRGDRGLLERILWRDMECVFQPRIIRSSIKSRFSERCRMKTHMDRDVLLDLYWHVVGDWYFHWIWNIWKDKVHERR